MVCVTWNLKVLFSLSLVILPPRIVHGLRLPSSTVSSSSLLKTFLLSLNSLSKALSASVRSKFTYTPLYSGRLRRALVAATTETRSKPAFNLTKTGGFYQYIFACKIE